MGGFVSGLLEKFGTKLADKTLPGITQKFEGTSAGRGVLNLFGNDEWELELNPEGKATKAMLQKYEKLRATSLDEGNKHQAEVWNWMKNDASARSALDPKKATIQDIHNYATVNRHPIAQTTQKILDQHLQPNGTSNAADKTMETLSYQNKAKAKLDGIAGSFGPKFENLSPLLARIQTHSDPRVNLNGDRILDIVSNVLRDTKKDDQGKLYSSTKAAVAKAFKAVNTLTDGKAGLIPPKAGDVTYYPPTPAEQSYKAILRTIQLPAIILPHLTQFAHVAATVPMRAWSEKLFQGTPQQAQQIIEASATLSNTYWDVLHSDILARTGKIAKWTNSPTAGAIVNKTFHEPGFQWMRMKQIAFTSTMGFHSAIHWAGEAVKGDKRALAELAEWGIDPADVIKQGGKLTDKQLTQAVFHFTNNKMFFSQPLDQSLYMNRNFFTRSMFMYHAFLNSETAFLRRELLKMSKAGDVKGIAQFIGVLGVAVPAVMPMLKSLEILARTGSSSQAGKEIKDDYNNLLGGGGPGAFIGTYIDMVATLGGIGIFRNYLGSIKGHMLLNSMVGPMIGVPVSHLQDLASGVLGEYTKKTNKGNPLRPLERDLLEDIPVIGRPLSHQLAPTTKEEPKHSFGRTRRHGLRRK